MRSALKINVKTDTFRSGYRYYALRKGRELGIVGTISGDRDSGCIVIHAEASDCILQRYINILRAGTPFCKVTAIMAFPDQLKHSIYFEILPTGIPKKETYTSKNKIRDFRIGFFGL